MRKASLALASTLVALIGFQEIFTRYLKCAPRMSIGKLTIEARHPRCDFRLPIDDFRITFLLSMILYGGPIPAF